jgi:N-carbamoyl-L-amino-acid hydrolase
VLQSAWTKPAIRFDAGCIAAIERAAAKAGARAERIVSGAGHDAANIAVLIPTAMIFIPCVGGLSHNELEAASQADCAAGAQVLLNAVIDYDAYWRDRQ